MTPQAKTKAQQEAQANKIHMENPHHCAPRKSSAAYAPNDVMKVRCDDVIITLFTFYPAPRTAEILQVMNLFTFLISKRLHFSLFFYWEQEGQWSSWCTFFIQTRIYLCKFWVCFISMFNHAHLLYYLQWLVHREWLRVNMLYSVWSYVPLHLSHELVWKVK